MHLRNTAQSHQSSQYGGSFDSKRSSKIARKSENFGSVQKQKWIGYFFFFFLDIVEIKEGGKKRKRNFVYEIREGRAYRAFLPSFRRMEKLLVFPWSTARSQILDVTFVPKNSDEQEGKGEEKVEILWKKCLTWLLLGRRHSVARRKTFFSRGPPWQPMVFFLFFTPRALRVNAKIYLRCYLWRREHAVHIQSLRH